MTSPEAEKQPRLRDNILALGVVQLSNYAIPLITLPYLTRVLGPEAYGKVAFAQVLMAYFILLTDYGFSWSATRKISAHRAERAYISRVFVGTWTAQWLLVFGTAALATVIVWASARLRPDAWMYAAAFTVVLGNALFPIWFLQGLERLKVVAGLQLFTRLLALIPIFMFVKEPADAVYVPAIQGGGVMLGGVLALGWIKQKNLLDWHWGGWRAATQELAEGLPLFGSRISISLYTILIPLTLGWIAGPVALANFTLADKLRTATQALLAPLSQALFPRMSHLFANDAPAAFSLLKRSALLVFIVAGSMSLMLWGLSNWLVNILAGPGFEQAAKVLQWIAFLPLLIGFSNLLGVQIMVPKKLNRPFNMILTTAGLTSLLIVWPLVTARQEIGAAQTFLITEGLVTASMMAFLWHRGHLSFRQKSNHDS